MKDKINLLLSQDRQSYLTKRQLYTYVIAISVMAFSFGIFYKKEINKTNLEKIVSRNLKLKKEQLQSQLRDFKSKYGELEVLKEKVNILDDEISIQKKIKFSKGKTNWAAVLEEFAANMPKNVWLTNFKGSKSGSNKFGILLGVAKSNKNVADFINFLEDSSVFKDIEFVFSKEKFINKHPLVEFEIKVKINGKKKNI